MTNMENFYREQGKPRRKFERITFRLKPSMKEILTREAEGYGLNLSEYVLAIIEKRH